MKRTEIQTGKAYAWKGAYPTQRVVILDSEPWMDSRDRKNNVTLADGRTVIATAQAPGPHTPAAAKGVLIQAEGRDYAQVSRLADIIGEWDTWHAEQTRLTELARARAVRDRDRKADRAQRIAAVSTYIEALDGREGYSPAVAPYEYGGRYSVTLEALELLVARSQRLDGLEK